MTNYDAIIKLDRERMESFLDQVYLAGLNTGTYASTLTEDQQNELLAINPFDARWLEMPAEEVLSSQEDDYILSSLTEAIFRLVAQNARKDEGEQALMDAVEESCASIEEAYRLDHTDIEDKNV